MKTNLACMLALLLFAAAPRSWAQDSSAGAEHSPTLLTAIDHRSITSLNGPWHAIVDPYATGLYDFHQHLRDNGYFLNQKHEADDSPLEYDFAHSPTLNVPGDWNTQRDSLFLYEGTVWYQKDFDYRVKLGNRLFIHIGAANYRSFVWINGKKACQHEGGFTPFDCEITQLIHDGANFAVIAVDSTRLADGLPTLQTDWWNYGGLTRDVSLVEVPQAFIDDYTLQLTRGTSNELDGWVHVEGAAAGTQVTIKIPEAHLEQTATTGGDGIANFHLSAPGLQLWSPENPKLYHVQIASGADTLHDEIGFRNIETHGSEIWLNGTPIFLRGISVHAEAPFRTGRAYSEQDARTLLGWAHDLGANFVRLAHYPHDERMTRLADKMGLLVWSEIPVYWAVEFENPAVLEKAKAQLHEMVRRDRNKASVILWSVANETPVNPARTDFLRTLVAQARREDPTRLIAAALLVRSEGNTKILDDPLGASLDVIGANEYIGWYERTPADADKTNWQIKFDKPLIISEFGAGAKAGMHGPASKRWTEEYQADLYRHQLGMLNRIAQLRGMSPWILMDFRSPRRPLPGIQDFFNRKGLISEEGKKKQAFYILQKAYQERSIGKAH